MLFISTNNGRKTGGNVMSKELECNVPIGQRQLFLDDYVVDKIENLKRTLRQPAKKGAVIRPDERFGVRSVQVRTAPIWAPEQKGYKFWDCAASPPDLQVGCSGYYESPDGLHWSKPVVGQIEYRGSRENNYISLVADGKHVRTDCVVRDPTDPETDRRYKAAIAATGFAVSPDGINWKMLDIPGVPSSDEFNFSFDEQEHLFILTVKHGGPYGRAVFLSTSEDFTTWTEPTLIFHADERDQELGRENIKARMANPTLQQTEYNNPAVYNVDVYNMGVFRYEGYYIGTPAMYHATGPVPNYPNTVGFHLVQLACSRDLKTWKRLGDRKPFIGPSPRDSGAYDLTQIIGPSNAIVRGDELWFYYTGLKYRGGWKYVGEFPDGEHVQLPGYDTDIGAICLAVLRRDGFVSLDAGESEGVLTTKPFILSGDRLCVNVDALDGELRAEALDEQGEVVAASEPLLADYPCVEVKWKQGSLANAKGQSVSLRFTLRNAHFYSFWLEG